MKSGDKVRRTNNLAGSDWAVECAKRHLDPLGVFTVGRVNTAGLNTVAVTCRELGAMLWSGRSFEPVVAVTPSRAKCKQMDLLFKAGDKVVRNNDAMLEGWVGECAELQLDPGGIFTVVYDVPENKSWRVILQEAPGTAWSAKFFTAVPQGEEVAK